MRSPLRHIVTAAAAAFVFGISTLAAPAAQATGTTISSAELADPGFASFGSSYYVYGTGPAGQNIPIYKGSSVNTSFTSAGYAFYGPNLDGYSKVWAPHVIYRNGYYFMFFTASHNGGTHCIYWAWSSTNLQNSYSKPTNLLCAVQQPGETWEAIDPSTYKTVEDNTYLVWRSGHVTTFPSGDYQIRAVMLSFSGHAVTTAAKAPRIQLLPEVHSVIEAPDMIRYGSKVYLFVSRGDFRNSTYRTEVYYADAIHDSFRFMKTLMTSTGGAYGSGPGGAEVLGISSTATRIAWHYRDGAGKRHVRTGVVSWAYSAGFGAYVPSVA